MTAEVENEGCSCTWDAAGATGFLGAHIRVKNIEYNITVVWANLSLCSICYPEPNCFLSHGHRLETLLWKIFLAGCIGPNDICRMHKDRA